MRTFLIFARRQSTAVVALAGAATLAGIVLVSRVSFDANVLRLLPQRHESVQAFRRFLEDFGSLDHLYLLFEADDAIGDHSEFVDAYVDELRKLPEIESVDAQLFEAGKDWSYLSEREMFLLGPADAAAALERFRSPGLERELAHARELLSMPSSQVKALVQQDPLGLLTMLRNRLSGAQSVVSFDPTQEGYVSKDGRSRLVIVKPKGQPFDTDFCKLLFQRLTAVEAGVRASAAREESFGSGPTSANVRVQAAGAYRVSLEAEQLIRREGIVNIVGSIALLLVITLAVFRTPWVMIYGCAPLALAALLTLGINGALQGSLSPATSGSAGMLFGLGIDGVILLYVRFLEERSAGASSDQAVERMSGTALGVILAQITTAAAFLALLVVDFPTLQDLGGLVGIGILICCAATLCLLPAFLPRRSDLGTRRAIATPWLGRLVTRWAGSIVLASAVATVALGAAATRLKLDTGIERLQARTQGAVLEQEIADRFSLPRDVLLAMGEDHDIEVLLETNARLTQALAARAPQVTAGSIAFMLPAAREQDRVAAVMTASATTSAAAADGIRRAGREAGFRAETFEPFLQHLPTLLNPAERISFDGLMSHGLESVVSRFVVRRDGRYRMVAYLYPKGSVDLDSLRQIIAEVSPNLHFTGLPVINHELRRQFMPQLLKGLAIGTTAVILLIYAVFRTARHTLLAMLPTALGLTWSAGLLALAGVELDLFSVFAEVTVIGIAVDYGIYVLSRHVIEQTADMAEVLTRTGAAIIVAFATAAVGFGTLINSSYAPLHLFGVVSLLTLTCCLAASLLTMPAVVIVIDRWSSAR